MEALTGCCSRNFVRIASGEPGLGRNNGIGRGRVRICAVAVSGTFLLARVPDTATAFRALFRVLFFCFDPLFEQVADFGKQLLFFRWRGLRGRRGRCRGGFFLPQELVHHFDHQENAEGQDGEVDALLDESPVVPIDRFRLGFRAGDKVVYLGDIQFQL